MSLDKAIKSGKEHRQKYYDSRRFDKECRSQGSCAYCTNGRQYQYRKALKEAIDKMKEHQHNG